MRRSIFLLAGAAGLAACGPSADEAAANQAAARAAAAKKPKPAYCFFKDPDAKGWKASRRKDGNITVKGKAYRQDPRYKAVLQPAVVTGSTATLSPTVSVNDTGFASPDNWWDLSETIQGSAEVDTVTVTCGAKTFAKLSVPRKK